MKDRQRERKRSFLVPRFFGQRRDVARGHFLSFWQDTNLLTVRFSERAVPGLTGDQWLRYIATIAAIELLK
jgi:hypothetical protein